MLPILVLLILGIIDFARAINDWNDETHVANLAARIASVGALPTSGECGTNNPAVTTLNTFIQCEVNLDSPGLKTGSGTGAGPSAVSVCVNLPPGATQFSPITVSITTNYKWLPFASGLVSTQIKGSATQSIENLTSNQPAWATTSAGCT